MDSLRVVTAFRGEFAVEEKREIGSRREGIWLVCIHNGELKINIDKHGAVSRIEKARSIRRQGPPAGETRTDTQLPCACVSCAALHDASCSQ